MTLIWQILIKSIHTVTVCFVGFFTNTGSERASDENISISNDGRALAERAMIGALVKDFKALSLREAFLKLGPL